MAKHGYSWTTLKAIFGKKMFPYRAAKACNNPISYNTYYLIFTCIYSKSSRMPLKQEFASSSFYYGLSHEFFIAQASDPANTYA